MIKTQSFKISSILSLNQNIQIIGSSEAEIDNVISITDVTEQINFSNSLSWINDKNATSFKIKCKIGLLICTESSYQKIKNIIEANFIITQKPRQFFQQILESKFKKQFENKIEPTSVVHPTAVLPKNCYIGHYTVIEEGVVIGENTYIGHHNSILARTIVGANVHIGNNNSIGHDGYGYEKNDNGDWQHMPHLGNVIIQDNVSLHSFIAIDKGVLGSTLIGYNSKIDNHVHISHNVQIGKNCILLQAAVIGGSAIIGDDCWIGHSVAIINKATIGKNCFFAGKALILKSMPDGSKYSGPAATKLDF
jgi:UDP-3-O-[3-hydroxymyristoyl] glucosamine N-acyltransferase